MNPKAALVLVVTLLAASPVWAGCDGLQIKDGWVPTAPPGATVMAGYLSLINSGKKALTVTAVSGKDFDDVGFHKTVIEGGMSKMLMLDNVSIAPQQTVRFEPNGMHLMLFSPKRAFKAGDTLRLAFSCGDKKSKQAEFQVKDAP